MSIAEKLSKIELGDADVVSRRLGALWSDRPVVLVFVRHFG